MWSNVLLEPKVFNRSVFKDVDPSLPNYLCPKCDKLSHWAIDEFPLCLNCDPLGVYCIFNDNYNDWDQEEE